ncbi:hypothetical protein BBG47_24445 [Paenibacillus sp. KS1]|nr:hypothetical protein BBG47_24445 [Paenibacillus sp. KS1]
MYTKAEQTYLSLSNITNFYAYDPEQFFLKRCLIDMLKMLAMGDVASLIRVYQKKEQPSKIKRLLLHLLTLLLKEIRLACNTRSTASVYLI